MTRLQQIERFVRVAAELEQSGALAEHFPERMIARYRDGVARTVIALAEMHRYATILDGVAVGTDPVIGKITK